MMLAFADDGTLTRLLAIASFALDVAIIFFVKPLRERSKKIEKLDAKIDTLEEKLAEATQKQVKVQFQHETVGLNAAMETLKQEMAECGAKFDRINEVLVNQVKAGFEQQLSNNQALHDLGMWVRDRTIGKEEFNQFARDIRDDIDRSGRVAEEAKDAARRAEAAAGGRRVQR